MIPKKRDRIAHEQKACQSDSLMDPPERSERETRLSKSSHIKGVPHVLRISAFMQGHGHPELAKKLNDKILKTMVEMFKRVRAFIRGEVAVVSEGSKGPIVGQREHPYGMVGRSRENQRKERSKRI
ncbi:hypothetical protein Tco_1229204 [Tanacetum coccineum]